MKIQDILGPSTHPHRVLITIDPADLSGLERHIENQRQLRLLEIDDSKPDVWSVTIGCASRRVADHVKEMFD